MKKKFNTTQEVVELIDRYKTEIDNTLSRIEQQKRLGDALRNTCEANRIRGIRDDVETMHREIEWRSGRLETLKEILGEMQTMTLPFASWLNDLELPGEVPAPSIEVENE